MSDLDFGFGSVVEVDIYGHTFDGEIVGTGPDNRDLEDDQYILAPGAQADQWDEIGMQEIIHEDDVVEVIHE